MKLKIAVLLDVLTTGGIQKTAIEEVKHLNKLGQEANMVVLSKTGYNPKNIPKNIKYQFLCDSYPRLLQKNFKIPPFKFLSTQHLLSPFIAPFYIKHSDYDLIISHGTTTSLTALSIYYTKKIPYFSIIYDPMEYILKKVYSDTFLNYLPFLKLVLNYIEKKIVTNASEVFVISHLHTKYIKSKHKVNPTILYLGINTHGKMPKSYGNSILALGRWEKQKNVSWFLELAETLPNAHFIIAGNWPNKNDLVWFKSQLNKINQNKNFEIIKKYDDEDLRKIIERASFWIHPNIEAFSVSALEVAIMGLPIVIPKGSGVTELFMQKKHGFFPKSKGEFFRKVAFLEKRPKLARKMGVSAAQEAKKYTWDLHTRVLFSKIKK